MSPGLYLRIKNQSERLKGALMTSYLGCNIDEMELQEIKNTLELLNEIMEEYDKEEIR